MGYTCTWIHSEKDSEGNAVHSVEDSTSWGNYNNDPVDGDNGKQLAGFKEEWKAKNIYDFAGNLYDFTCESYSSDRRIRRGGGYLSSNRPASYRYDFSVSNPYKDLSFRIVLYVI